MLFKDIFGREELKQQLLEMANKNRLSHAMLFLGKEGSGSLLLALVFAQYISLLPDTDKQTENSAVSLFAGEHPKFHFPETPEEADKWMQNQSAYLKASRLVHPDIHFSYPVITKKPGDKPISTDFITEWREFINLHPYGNVFDWLQFLGAENKQGNITVEECTDIIRKLSLKSFESEYKIIIIWMPEYLGKSGNKLLKLIEEPPPDTLFILVAENEEQILPTILSRCQLIKIPLPAKIDIQHALQQRTGVNEDVAAQIAAVSEGNYHEALQLLQHSEEDWLSILSDWLKFIIRNMLTEQVKWIEDISKLGREKQKQLLQYFNHLVEQSIRLKAIGEEVNMPAKEKDFAQRLGKVASISQQQVILEELDKAAYYIERNANTKLLFHALTIKLYHIIQHKTLILAN